GRVPTPLADAPAGTWDADERRRARRTLEPLLERDDQQARPARGARADRPGTRSGRSPERPRIHHSPWRGRGRAGGAAAGQEGVGFPRRVEARGATPPEHVPAFPDPGDRGPGRARVAARLRAGSEREVALHIGLVLRDDPATADAV